MSPPIEKVESGSSMAVDPSDRKFYLKSPDPEAVRRFDAALKAQLRMPTRSAPENPRQEPDMEHLINLATGRTYTDRDLAEAISRADARAEQEAIDLTSAVNNAERTRSAQEIERTVKEGQEHNEELNYYIQSAGQLLTPGQLAEAVDEYINNQDQEWRDEHMRLEAELAESGENYLTELATGDINDFKDRNDPQVQTAVTFALQRNPDLLNNVDVESVIDAIDGQTGENIAKIYFQNEVIGSFADLKDGSPAEIAAARESLDTLRNDTFASIFTENGDPHGWNETLDALEATLYANDPLQAYEELTAQIDDSSSLNEDSPLSYTLKSLGLAATNASGEDFSLNEERTLLSKAQLLNDGLTATVGYPITRLNIPNTSISGAVANGVSKLIGIASVGLSAAGVVESAVNGDGAGAFFNGGVLVGSTIAFVAPGVGTAIALGFSAASLAYNHANKMELSNKYTTLDSDTRGNAINFISHSDLDSDTAVALLDRSAEGHSPIPLFFRKGEHEELSFEETLDYINEVHKDGNLKKWRNHYHEVLDSVDGDVSEVQIYDLVNLERPRAQPQFGHSDSGSGHSGGHQDTTPDNHHPGMDGNGLPSTNSG